MAEKKKKDIVTQLGDALQHAEDRLNEIPHKYEDTDFEQIREALKAYKEYKRNGQNTYGY